MAPSVKNPSAVRETWVRFLDREDPLEEGMRAHSSILSWRILMDRGAWWAMIHGVAKSQTWLRDQEQNSNILLTVMINNFVPKYAYGKKIFLISYLWNLLTTKNPSLLFDSTCKIVRGFHLLVCLLILVFKYIRVLLMWFNFGFDVFFGTFFYSNQDFQWVWNAFFLG